MCEQTHYTESFYSKLFFLIYSFCLHPPPAFPAHFGQVELCGPSGLRLILYAQREAGSELAITFLHYKILTSWRCEEGVEVRLGTVSPHLLPGESGEQCMA